MTIFIQTDELIILKKKKKKKKLQIRTSFSLNQCSNLLVSIVVVVVVGLVTGLSKAKRKLICLCLRKTKQKVFKTKKSRFYL